MVREKGKVRMWAASLFILLLLSGCMDSSTKLAEGFDKESLQTAAENLIEKVNQNDYDGFIEDANEKLKEAITKEKFESGVSSYITAKGKFESVGKMAVIGQTDKNTQENFGVVVAIGEYSEGSIQFTISFDKNMKLAGFYIK